MTRGFSLFERRILFLVFLRVVQTLNIGKVNVHVPYIMFISYIAFILATTSMISTYVCACNVGNLPLYTIAGSEMRSWILFYSIPVLMVVIARALLQSLVTSLHILWADRIRRSSLTTVKRYLNCFYKEFSNLYGKHFYSRYSIRHILMLLLGVCKL